MKKIIKTWQERAEATRVKCGVDELHDHSKLLEADCEIHDLRAYISELEARTPAATVEAEEYKTLFIEWWLTDMHNSEFFNRTVKLLGVTTEDLDQFEAEHPATPVMAVGLQRYNPTADMNEGSMIPDDKGDWLKRSDVLAAHPVAGSPAEARCWSDEVPCNKCDKIGWHGLCCGRAAYVPAEVRPSAVMAVSLPPLSDNDGCGEGDDLPGNVYPGKQW